MNSRCRGRHVPRHHRKSSFDAHAPPPFPLPQKTKRRPPGTPHRMLGLVWLSIPSRFFAHHQWHQRLRTMIGTTAIISIIGDGYQKSIHLGRVKTLSSGNATTTVSIARSNPQPNPQTPLLARSVRSTVVDVGVHKEGQPERLEVVGDVFDVDLFVAVPLADCSGVSVQLLHPAKLPTDNWHTGSCVTATFDTATTPQRPINEGAVIPLGRLY